MYIRPECPLTVYAGMHIICWRLVGIAFGYLSLPVGRAWMEDDARRRDMRSRWAFAARVDAVLGPIDLVDGHGARLPENAGSRPERVRVCGLATPAAWSAERGGCRGVLVYLPLRRQPGRG